MHFPPRLRQQCASVLADDDAVLTDDDPIGIGMRVHWLANRRGEHRVFVVVEAHRAGLDTEAGTLWNPSKRPAYTPRTNGKAERFIQTSLREWAFPQSRN